MNKSLSYMVIIVIIMIVICYLNAQQPTYNLYYTDMIDGDLSHDCLYFAYDQSSQVDGIIYVVEQTIEYCFRPMVKKKDIINEFGNSSILTFDEMKKKNITTENLIEWSSPIDLVERYENYLQTNQSSSNETFYKCIVPWFGPFCQYSFDFNQTFSNIVKVQIHWKSFLTSYSKFACYIHMKCDRYSSRYCLDWRQICDGTIDCVDGEDEQNCFELEINQCSENEYQCRNGMCVDKAFLLDDAFDMTSPECLDGSDESVNANRDICSALINFACEDTTCRYPQQLTCGDGTVFESVLPRDELSCPNARDFIFNYFVNWDNKNDTRFPHCFKMLVCTNEDLESNDFNKYCKNLCQNAKKCKIQILESCPFAFIAPTFPVWDGHVRLGYFSNQTVTAPIDFKPKFVCYDKDRCSFLIPTFILENYTCIHTHLLNLSNFNDLILKFVPCRRLYQSRNETHCQRPNMLRCLGTDKCISHRRILDGISDCYGDFDESPATNSCALNDKYRFKCTSENKCLSPMLVDDKIYQCIGGEDEHYTFQLIAMNIEQLPFSALCDASIDMVNSNNETDEMYCEKWPCLNQYTRCNEVWNCPRGEDEVNCSSNFECPPNHHPCLFPNNVTMGCLHINYADDGIVNCLGSTDERSYWKSNYTANSFPSRCWNATTHFFIADDVCAACAKFDNIAHLCQQTNKEAEDIINYMDSANHLSSVTKKPFSHRSSHSFPPIQFQSPIDESDQEDIIKIPETPIYESMDDRDVWSCYRGILIRIGKNKTVGCLCSPNYYGDRCQYQNERVSLTLRFRKENFEKLDIIGIVITLVDHTDLVHSHDQITYIPTEDCNTKFNLHLLYQTRPKDLAKNYTINIDAYDKVNLTYLTSWTVSIPFTFMPVNRVSAQLTIPSQQNCHLLCNHKYAESLRNVNLDSCHCKRNLSDLISTIRNKCDCSPDSICVGFANNRSICLCSLNRTGPRCFIKSICQNETCKNGGLCVSYNVRSSYPYVVCACPEGYSGVRCEQKAVSIDISFSGVKMNESLLLHYIEIPKEDYAFQKLQLPRATMFKKILYHQNTIKISMSSPFHLLFAQVSDFYYLLILQHNYTSSINFSVQISPSQYCPHIRELFDEQIVRYPILRRVQYYHGLCKNYSDLLCFHDAEVFMCLCTKERHANCFHFNFNMTYNCQGNYECENDAKCYQDHPQCPKTRMCVCPECFYGTKCQFNVKHFGLSLDSIIGYHIYPNLPIPQQSASVKTSISVSIVMLVVAIISGTLSIWTFQVKACRETGCGIYLYVSSIISIITICILNLKLWFLILSQMNIITSNGFLLFNCITMDFLLRTLLALIDWLYACVATERLLVAYLGVKFVKAKSKRAAKRAIIVIIVVIGLSLVHDPIHRRLFDDTEDKRTWCLVRYTHNVATYNTVIDIIHFIIPFSINLLSAIGIIVFTAKQRTTAGKAQDNLMEQLKKQFSLHKHLLVSSILLVILGLPRLIISFLPNCMISPREYKLYLSGYFISFIPSLLTFFIFVLTSRTYKKECYSQSVRKWAAFKRRFNFIEFICRRQ